MSLFCLSLLKSRFLAFTIMICRGYWMSLILVVIFLVLALFVLRGFCRRSLCLPLFSYVIVLVRAGHCFDSCDFDVAVITSRGSMVAVLSFADFGFIFSFMTYMFLYAVFTRF